MNFAIFKRNLRKASFDPALSKELFSSYSEVRNRYIAGDWQPQELNGGRFCEALAAFLFNYDAQRSTGFNRDFSRNMQYIQDENGSRSHRIDTKTRRWFVKIIRATKGFRDDRDVAHISPTYSTSHLDSSYVLNNVKWLMAELIRVISGEDPEKVEEFIEQSLEADLPAIDDIEGEQFVNVDLSTNEEILAHLFKGYPFPLLKKDLKKWIPKSARMVDLSLNQLSKARLIKIMDDQVHLSSSGRKRAEAVLQRLRNVN